MRPSFRQQLPRRSLLARPLQDVSDAPLWRSLLMANIVVTLLTLGWSVLSGSDLDMSRILSGWFRIAVYTSSITVLAHYGSSYVEGQAVRNRWPGWLRLVLLAITWMLSGSIGSLLSYWFLCLTTEQVFELSWIVPIVLNNSVVALTIGTIVFFFGFAGVTLRQRRADRGQKDLLTAEFQAAQSVQRSLLPDRDIQIQGFDISGSTSPAVEIGGDYYDYLSFADGTKALIVADAAGKGIPAALVMAKFQGMAQALSIHVSNAREFFVGLNDTLRIRLDRKNFITVGMLTIDFDDRICFYRAGHNPLLRYSARTGAVEEIRPSGMALGLAHGAALGRSMEEVGFDMEPGDVALLCSDGLTEGVNETGVEFGDTGIVAALQHAGRSSSDASAIRQSILAALREFVGEAAQHDDITLVVLRKT